MILDLFGNRRQEKHEAFAEFELLLQQHPAISDFNKERIMGLRLRIDYEGLAQHFGLKTELFDFTSNPMVAAFFACCEFDHQTKKYHPILEPRDEGVVYALNEAFDTSVEEIPCSSIVGLQPLSRPGRQYAWACRLPKGATLNNRRFIETIRFAHDAKSSQKIFEYFEGGAKLFPHDPVVDKACAIAKSMILSEQAVLLAISRYRKGTNEESVLADLTRMGLEIVNYQPCPFSSTEREQIQKQWDRYKDVLLSRIHWRRACYPI